MPCVVDLPSLAGFGTVEVLIKESGIPGLYHAEESTYTFTNPIPEPATFLLLGFGLIGLGIKKSRKGKA